MKEISRKINGRKVNAHCSSGHGNPVVFIHGLMDSADSWDAYAEDISRPTIAVDLPGFGLSETIDNPSLASYAKVIQTFLTRAGVKRYHLVGHSLGAAVAKEMSDRHPKNIVSLTFISPTGFGKIGVLSLLENPLFNSVFYTATPLAIKLPSVIAFSYSNFISHHKRIDPMLKDRFSKGIKTMIPGLRAAFKILKCLSDNPFTSSKYTGKTTVIWGKHDRLTPYSNLKLFIKIYPEAKVHSLNVGHHPQHETKKCFDIVAQATESRALVAA